MGVTSSLQRREEIKTSSATFLICKIGTGIPYLAEVLRSLISICRALRKTKHKAKRCSLAGGCSAEHSQASTIVGAAGGSCKSGRSQDVQVLVAQIKTGDQEGTMMLADRQTQEPRAVASRNRACLAPSRACQPKQVPQLPPISHSVARLLVITS